MESGFARAVVSFAIVAAAYWAYLNVAEPLMASPSNVTRAASPGGGHAGGGLNPAPVNPTPGPTAPAATERFQAFIAPHFPADSWERTSARVLKNDQFMLLLRELKTTEDGRLHVSPCTIVFQPDGLQSAGSTQESNRTWIVQAPQGAVLAFDEPLDERLINVGRLQQAFVQGKVTIRGSETAPGAGDQIELTTQNVQLSEQRIWTPHEVHFRIGPHFGSGRDLTIAMAPVTRGEFNRLPATIPARVQSVELVHLDKLQVSLPTERNVTTADGQLLKQLVHIPISIDCQGYLLVEMARGVAQMTERVHVARPRLDDTGLTDHLDCDQVTFYFDQQLTVSDDPSDPSTQLALDRVVATGQPAMAYTCQPGGNLTTAVYSLEAPRFEVGLSPQREFVAEGAGRIRGALGERAQDVEVTWQGRFKWQQNDLGAQINLEQQAQCSVAELGQVSAEQMQLQLAPSADQVASGQPVSALGSLQPVAVTATGRVRADMRQIKAQVNRMLVSFREQELSQSGGSLQLTGPQPARSRDRPERRFIVTGNELQVGIVKDKSQALLDEVVIDQQVRCLEVASNNEGRGAELTGDRMELRQIASGAAVGLIRGAPVKLRANRMDVRGALVRFEQGSNRLWIDGAGSAALPLPLEVAQQFAGRPAVGYLNWQDSLSFDGSSVRADGDVEVRGPSQLIRCASVVGQLSKPIRMDDATAGARLEAEGVRLTAITADGGVFIENRTFDESGLISVDTGNMPRIHVNQETSEIQGVGPGWIKTVRRGNALAGANVLGGNPRDTVAGNDQLSYLRVDFQRQITGNLRVRRIAFNDRVRALYGPVPGWDNELNSDPRSLSAGQVSLRCDQLSVLQMLRRGQQQSPFEFQALGNTIVEGTDFTARAHRLSYDQGKDQLVLEGRDGADAHIRRAKPGQGSQETSARKIQFWPKSKRIEVQGADVIELRG